MLAAFIVGCGKKNEWPEHFYGIGETCVPCGAGMHNSDGGTCEPCSTNLTSKGDGSAGCYACYRRPQGSLLKGHVGLSQGPHPASAILFVGDFRLLCASYRVEEGMTQDPTHGRWRVEPDDAGIRLDKFVAQCGDVSRRIARTWISSGRVRIKGQVIRILTRPLRAGTWVEILTESSSAPQQAAQTGAEPEIIYQDRALLVLNKPPQLLSESDRFGSPSLETIAPKMLERAGQNGKVWLVHRLDAVTSGVIVMARTPRAVRELNEVFREGKATKTYLALVSGYLRKGRDIDAPLARLKGTKQGVVPSGKPAHTHVAPLQTNRNVTLVRATPTTGRTHQIRVHLASIELPLLGDRLYGGPGYTGADTPEPIPRAMLHARRLVIPHPISGETMTFEAPVPDDFVSLAQAEDIWPTEV